MRRKRFCTSWSSVFRRNNNRGRNSRFAALSFMRKGALAIVLAAGLSPAVALAQSTPPPTQSSFSTTPARVRDWANRLLAKDPAVRRTAEAALVKGAPRSLPLLRRFLTPEHEDL